MTDPTNSAALALVEVTELLRPVIEFAAGYHAQLVADGWPEAQARSMAATAHNALITRILAGDH